MHPSNYQINCLLNNYLAVTGPACQCKPDFTVECIKRNGRNIYRGILNICFMIRMMLTGGSTMFPKAQGVQKCLLCVGTPKETENNIDICFSQ